MRAAIYEPYQAAGLESFRPAGRLLEGPDRRPQMATALELLGPAAQVADGLALVEDPGPGRLPLGRQRLGRPASR